MFKNVTVEDFSRTSGGQLPQVAIEDELIRLGGGTWDGLGFKNKVLAQLGYNVNNPPSDITRAATYNIIAASLNKLGSSVTANSLCNDLGIQI
jgi:hypothetical protein